MKHQLAPAYALLILMYINDIVNISKAGKIMLHTDDTDVFFLCSILKELQAAANAWLLELNERVSLNQLECNTRKTKFVLFSCKE